MVQTTINNSVLSPRVLPDGATWKQSDVQFTH